MHRAGTPTPTADLLMRQQQQHWGKMLHEGAAVLSTLEQELLELGGFK